MSKTKSILVVDDERNNLVTMQAILKSLGYHSETATDGAQALEKLGPRFDLILLDVMMPGMDGFETARLIRRNPAFNDIPIIMVTVLSDKEDRLRAVEAGANDFVTKPIDKTELRVRMESLLKMKEAQDAIKEHRTRLEEIVDHRTAELKESEHRYRSLFNDSPDAIFVSSRDGRISEVNQAFLDLFGFTRDEVLRISVTELVSHPGEERDLIQAVRRDGVARNYELQLRTKKGAIRDCLAFSSARRDANGRFIGCQSVVHDITERKRSERALKASEERMRMLIESLPVGITILNDGKYSYVNPAFARMFGYDSAREIVGLATEDLYSVDSRDMARDMSAVRALDDNYMQSCQMKGMKKDGSPIDVSVWTTSTDFGNETALLGIVLDVTEEMALRAQLLRTQKMEAIGTLAGGIAHDFNNILSVIMGYLDLALQETPANSRVRMFLDRIQDAGERATDLVRQILTLSRQGEQEKKPTLLSPIIKETIRFLRASIPSTIRIHHRIEEDSGTVLAAPTQIHQVFMNLCTNAAHAMRESGGLLEVSLSQADWTPELGPEPTSLASGRYLKLRVRDSGHGIPPEVIDRIFEPYFTTKSPGEGTGLGLAVVHGIVKGHGGAITVNSEVGAGSEFNVFLPLIEQEAAVEQNRETVFPTGQGRVLFVDDEHDLVEMGQLMLEKLGYEVVTSTDGTEALAKFQADPQKFDLAITDMTMPNLTGAALARQLLEIRPDLPVVLCTGYSELITEERAKAMGIKEFAIKPLRQGELAKIIRKILKTPK